MGIAPSDLPRQGRHRPRRGGQCPAPTEARYRHGPPFVLHQAREVADGGGIDKRGNCRPCHAGLAPPSCPESRNLQQYREAHEFRRGRGGARNSQISAVPAGMVLRRGWFRLSPVRESLRQSLDVYGRAAGTADKGEVRPVGLSAGCQMVRCPRRSAGTPHSGHQRPCQDQREHWSDYGRHVRQSTKRVLLPGGGHRSQRIACPYHALHATRHCHCDCHPILLHAQEVGTGS
mmetsp:Transcript_25498/g.56690  ORF Transcript_25498/g.56690 Transcript_25498/m.56690 type:complete len:232 (+) Transcript_25498:350-1045(+)